MSASKKPPPVTARAFCFARKGLETQQDYLVPASSIGVAESATRTPSVAVVKVSNTVEDLDTRLSTTLSKELSNSESRASGVVCEVVKPAFTGPKGE